MASDLVYTGQPFSLADNTIKPNIVISRNGRSATIYFGGDAVEFRGDLPVSEAAQEFFKHVHALRHQARDAALEEAAKVAEAVDPEKPGNWLHARHKIAFAIRALRGAA